MTDSTPRSPHLVPLAIAMAGLLVAVGTSIWVVLEMRGNAEGFARSATAQVSGPSVDVLQPGSRPSRPGAQLNVAWASVDAAGSVTQSFNTKPTVKAESLSALEELLGPVMPAGLDPKGLWCLKGGPWSIKGVSTKKSGGAFVVDSSHEPCDGVFVASFDKTTGKPLPFRIDIAWMASN